MRSASRSPPHDGAGPSPGPGSEGREVDVAGEEEVAKNREGDVAAPDAAEVATTRGEAILEVDHLVK